MEMSKNCKLFHDQICTKKKRTNKQLMKQKAIADSREKMLKCEEKRESKKMLSGSKIYSYNKKSILPLMEVMNTLYYLLTHNFSSLFISNKRFSLGFFVELSTLLVLSTFCLFINSIEHLFRK